jgi:hypothetical protein
MMVARLRNILYASVSRESPQGFKALCGARTQQQDG